MRVRNALLSASDKAGLDHFAHGLLSLQVRILSTGGTARFLSEHGVPVTDVASYSGAPEILDGRVKTLHPRIHGGILARRDREAHLEEMARYGIEPIDLVVVNLYPFEEVVARSGTAREEALEWIDIGGPAMVRAAAKNHRDVAVVVDPGDYDAVLDEMRARAGELSSATLERLACKAFERTAAYDLAIAQWLGGAQRDPPRTASLIAGLEGCGRRLRYGENPHQEAFVIVRTAGREAAAATGTLLWGKALSYNNLLDSDAALELVRELPSPAAAVIKHLTPCGVAVGGTALQAFSLAYAVDPVSAFGGIVAFNETVGVETARALADPEKFLEVLVAPGFTPDALGLLRSGPPWCERLRVLQTGALGERVQPSGYMIRSLRGALLCQTGDYSDERLERVVTRRLPTDEERAGLELAWAIVKHVKSNGIALVNGRVLVGVGAGQTSRVEAVEIAVRKAASRARGAVMASDAFFPFADGIEVAARAGVTAVVQPGGSVRDRRIIETADALGLAMIFTGVRHFRH
ncbi:MAG: bifunctional phosphoribosylaminoimidazolecarboxamide formyltransferase/IMP cyclohydrolase [Planctomycetota bacterium]